jgi:demethylmenaquinone methyltransferase/2-methoxy-6-polyprenyl-1,4-benzoquinol methylase
VKELFTRIAPRYDFINDLQSFGLHRVWKRRLIDLAQPKTNERALDLCCGTGDLAFALARRGARVVGLDFTDRMLEVAIARNHQQALPDMASGNQSSAWSATGTTPYFVQGDALETPFPDRSFDIVTVAYGLRNLADLTAGLREMQRVAKPGARLLVLDFGKPDSAVWRKAYFAYLKVFVPVLGRIFCGSASAYAYILESLKHYPAQRGVAAEMEGIGLANVRIVNLLGGVMSVNYAESPGGPSSTSR